MGVIFLHMVDLYMGVNGLAVFTKTFIISIYVSL